MILYSLNLQSYLHNYCDLINTNEFNDLMYRAIGLFALNRCSYGYFIFHSKVQYQKVIQICKLKIK